MRLLPVAALALLTSCCASAPAPLTIPDGEDPERWADDVRGLLEARPDHAEPVVFLGSSSIRLWSSLADDMAPLPVVNYGFGGSRIFDGIYWLEALLEGVDARAFVVFIGTNDIAGDEPRQPEWVAARFDELVDRIRALGSDAPLLYLAISPTPSRERHLALVLEANRLIAERCAADPSLTYVDTASALLDGDGRPDPRWFRADRLHLNADGYASWTATVRPALEAVLQTR